MTMHKNTRVVHDTPWSRENEVSLGDYLMVVRRAWWKILVVALGVSLVAATVVSMMTPIYQASVTIIIEPQTPKVISIDEVYTPDSGNSEEYYRTQYEILKSRPLAEQVIASLNLFDDTENRQPEQRMQLAVKEYFKDLRIEPVKNTQLVEVQFSSADPSLAAAVANSHADAYMQSILNAKMAITNSGAEWMVTRLESLKKNLDESERKLQAFREKENLVDSESLQHLPSLELNELTMKLIDAQQELSLAKNIYWQVARWRADNKGAIDSIPSLPVVLNDPLVQQLRNQQGAAKQKVEELIKRYGPLHPQMVTARENLKSIEDNLLNQVTNVIQGLRKQYQVAVANEAAVVEAIDATKNQYHELGRKASELEPLKREVEANRELYDLFFTRIKETAEMGSDHSVNARIISPAIVPLEPVKPQKGLTITMAFAASLLMGVVVAFVRDSMNNSLINISDVEFKLGYPLLGVAPLIKSEQGEKRRRLISKPIKDVPEGRFLEAMRSIHTGLVLSGKPNKTIMVTSSLSHEGKSNLAMNLAYSCALLERVVLVECDLYRPIIAGEFEFAVDTPGLAEIKQGKASLDDCLIEHENFHVVTAGSQISDSLEVISSPEFKQLLKSLATKFDRVILDCPPTLLVSDPALISTYSDMVVYVVRTDSTQISQIKNGLEKLARIKSQVIKIVVNGLDVPLAEKYSDYSDYYDDAYKSSD